MARPKGSTNVITRDVRALLKGIIQGEIQELPKRLDSMSDEKRIDVLLKIIPYVLPKVEAVAHHEGEPFTIDTWE